MCAIWIKRERIKDTIREMVREFMDAALTVKWGLRTLWEQCPHPPNKCTLVLTIMLSFTVVWFMLVNTSNTHTHHPMNQILICFTCNERKESPRSLNMIFAPFCVLLRRQFYLKEPLPQKKILMEKKKKPFVMLVLMCLQSILTNIIGRPLEMRGLVLRFP